MKKSFKHSCWCLSFILDKLKAFFGSKAAIDLLSDPFMRKLTLNKSNILASSEYYEIFKYINWNKSAVQSDYVCLRPSRLHNKSKPRRENIKISASHKFVTCIWNSAASETKYSHEPFVHFLHWKYSRRKLCFQERSSRSSVNKTVFVCGIICIVWAFFIYLLASCLKLWQPMYRRLRRRHDVCNIVQQNKFS